MWADARFPLGGQMNAVGRRTLYVGWGGNARCGKTFAARRPLIWKRGCQVVGRRTLHVGGASTSILYGQWLLEGER